LGTGNSSNFAGFALWQPVTLTAASSASHLGRAVAAQNPANRLAVLAMLDFFIIRMG
jgi:hypothetical protein